MVLHFAISHSPPPGHRPIKVVESPYRFPQLKIKSGHHGFQNRPLGSETGQHPLRGEHIRRTQALVFVQAHHTDYHADPIALENLICDCWAKVEWGYGRILVRDGANAGWINYMLKDHQKSEFDGFVDCMIIESLHNPIADA
jgi:hypothetical protein